MMPSRALCFLIVLATASLSAANKFCDETKCTSFGNDCCAPLQIKEAATCKDGYKPYRKEEDGGCFGYAEGLYDCCLSSEESTDNDDEVVEDGDQVCDDTKCSSIGNDCCAPFNEKATCRDGFSPIRKNGGCSIFGEGLYTCCKDKNEPEPADYGTCDTSKCTSFGNDCCAPFNEAATCKDGFTATFLQGSNKGCLIYDHGNYTCCVGGETPSPQEPSASHQICDSGKCSSHGDDCCAPLQINEEATCRDGFQPIRKSGNDAQCFGFAEGMYDCCKGPEPPASDHEDPSPDPIENMVCDDTKCSSYGNDCCAPLMFGEQATCRDGFQSIRKNKPCSVWPEGLYQCCRPSDAQQTQRPLPEYRYIPQSVDRSQAKDKCEEFGGYLAGVINNEERHRGLEVISAANHQTGRDQDVWIGLERKTPGGDEFVWSNLMLQSGFYSWRKGEPNNSGGAENCVVMGPKDGRWNDAPCDEKREYVCENLTTQRIVKPFTSTGVLADIDLYSTSLFATYGLNPIADTIVQESISEALMKAIVLALGPKSQGIKSMTTTSFAPLKDEENKLKDKHIVGLRIQVFTEVVNAIGAGSMQTSLLRVVQSGDLTRLVQAERPEITGAALPQVATFDETTQEPKVTGSNMIYKSNGISTSNIPQSIFDTDLMGAQAVHIPLVDMGQYSVLNLRSATNIPKKEKVEANVGLIIGIVAIVIFILVVAVAGIVYVRRSARGLTASQRRRSAEQGFNRQPLDLTLNPLAADELHPAFHAGGRQKGFQDTELQAAPISMGVPLNHSRQSI